MAAAAAGARAAAGDVALIREKIQQDDAGMLSGWPASAAFT